MRFVRWWCLFVLACGLLSDMLGSSLCSFALADSPVPDAGSVMRTAAAQRTTTRPSTRLTTARPGASQPAQTRQTQTIQHDFGQAWAGDPITHTFELVNTTDQAVTIQSVQTFCGCTTTGDWDKQILPGATWKLTARFDTAGRKGRISREIRVKTSDPARPQVDLVLSGQIKPRLEFSSGEIVQLGGLQGNTHLKRTITISNNYDEPITLKDPAVDTKSLAMQLREVEPGQRYELDLETVPPLREGALTCRIKLATDLKEQPEVSLAVYGNVQPRVMLFPRILMIRTPSSSDARRWVDLRVDGQTHVKVTGAEVSDPQIQVQQEPGPDGQTRGFWVTIPQGVNLPNAGQTLTVHTDDPEFATLTCKIQPLRISSSRPATRPAGTQPAMRADAR